MLSKKIFWDWFKREVEVRWPKCHFSWTEMGDWHWRLEAFDIDTLTQAVRKHKTCEDWRTPSVKKVYEYASSIRTRNRPQQKRKDQSALPPEHTFIMCTAKDDRGRGNVGWFMPILLWPFRVQWKPEDYARVAEQQKALHARRGGIWEIFTNTCHGNMLTRSCNLRGTKPLDVKRLRRRHQNTSGSSIHSTV